MMSRFDAFDQIAKRFHKLLAAGVLLLVLGLVIADIIHAIWFRPPPALDQMQRLPTSFPIAGCKTMPNGMKICHREPPFAAISMN